MNEALRPEAPATRVAREKLNTAPNRGRLRTMWALLLVALLAGPGCIGFQAVNEPLTKVNPDAGYRPSVPEGKRPRGRTIIYLAFSGGGTRAAAFSYGVMRALKASEIEVDGVPMSVMDEVDTLSGVSGGSFPAAYYALYGDRIFDEFEDRFLRRNVQRALIWRALNPWNTIRLMTPWLSRSDMASKYYSKHVFEHATFETLTNTPARPRLYINATDLTSGHLFTFGQGQFDMMCSDLNPLPISTAIASSSAVPMLLSPVTLRNYAGTCGYEIPEWLEEGLKERRTNPRRYRAARSFAEFIDPTTKKYVHLVDGGISDNLGLRAGIDLVSAAGGITNIAALTKSGPVDRLVVISVNAETDPNRKVDLSAASPGFAQLMNSVSGGQIRRYNFESLLLIRSSLAEWEADLNKSGMNVTTHLIEVSFENLAEEEDRRYFKGLPTSFSLKKEQVDRLIAVGEQLTLESPQYQAFLEELR